VIEEADNMTSKILGPKDLIPMDECIVDEALEKMSSKMKPDYIEKNFYKVVDEAMKNGIRFIFHMRLVQSNRFWSQ